MNEEPEEPVQTRDFVFVLPGPGETRRLESQWTRADRGVRPGRHHARLLYPPPTPESHWEVSYPVHDTPGATARSTGTGGTTNVFPVLEPERRPRTGSAPDPVRGTNDAPGEKT